MSMIKVENLTFSYPSGYENIFENVNFKIDTDWKLGFIGRNGRGKTTFLKLLMGMYAYEGKISSSVIFDYFPYQADDESLLTNEVLAGIFGMKNWEPFAGGCGRVGEVEPITVPELARKAQAVLGGRCNRPRSGPAVQVKFADTGKTVKRLAVISGAGGSMFEDALAVGADCLLTGEANHHAAIDAVRLGLSLVAAGHYATEFPVCAAIADRLRTAFPELGVRVSGENRDPFTYI